MKLKSILLAILMIACMVVPLAACDTAAEVSSVELDQATLTINVGEQATLTYTVFPQEASGISANWRSSDATVATVDNGVVKGIKDGKAAIRVSVGGKSSQCIVTVVDPSKQPVPVSAVSLDKQSLSLNVGDTYLFVPNVEPENATDKTLTWESSNTSVASVSISGLVTAVGGGQAVITATSTNNYRATCVVTVAGEASANELYVGDVPSLKDRTDFIMAMDASELLSVEKARSESGLTFKDFDGQDADILQVLKDNGITDIRIRVWNDPYADSAKTQPYGGGNCDVDNAVALSERCQAVGLGVIIDFHYSDFWADPGKQKAPKAWANMGLSAKADALESFTEDALTQIKATDVKITMVQIGNETTGGMAGETNWTNISLLMNAGARAVRKVTGAVAEGGAKIAVHFTNAGDNTYYSKAQTLKNNNVDYDVFGTSWYPYYTSHGSLSALTKQLANVHKDFGKDVMVLETAYAFSQEDFDGCGGTALETTTQPITVQGMANAVREVIKAIADLGDYGLGVAYWGGTWVAASDSTEGATNRDLCLRYGCGWATSYAHSYDSSAPAASPTGAPVGGGSMVDNNAFFLSDGSPIEALKVFKYVKGGHTTDLRADYLSDQEVYYTVNEGTIELPKTVSIVLNNGSKQVVDAIWNIEQAQLTQYISAVDMYTVTGTTLFGGTCYCYVWVMNVNILDEGSFEGFRSYGDATVKFVQADLGNWRLRYTKTENLQLFVSNNTGNARMGTNSFHFWDDKSVDFDLYQTVDVSKLQTYGSGKWGCSFDFQGADGTNCDIHAYITVKYKDGTEHTFTGTQAQMNGWQKWTRTSVTGAEFDPSNVQSVTVGIHVKADFTGAGPWGNIDNAQFYFEG